jgi:archaellum component FlaF (FlaF/FlaG flagellin family)
MSSANGSYATGGNSTHINKLVLYSAMEVTYKRVTKSLNAYYKNIAAAAGMVKIPITFCAF